MALPIKAIPDLEGEAADRFLKILEQNGSKRITKEEQEQMKAYAEAIMKKSKL